MPVDPILKKPKGIAIFDFDIPESAARAIASVNTTLII
jgi:hypothetical protein